MSASTADKHHTSTRNSFAGRSLRCVTLEIAAATFSICATQCGERMFTCSVFEGRHSFSAFPIQRKENGVQRECVPRMSRKKANLHAMNHFVTDTTVAMHDVRARPCCQVDTSCLT